MASFHWPRAGITPRYYFTSQQGCRQRVRVSVEKIFRAPQQGRVGKETKQKQYIYTQAHKSPKKESIGYEMFPDWKNLT